jgi:hypothetical protein
MTHRVLALAVLTGLLACSRSKILGADADNEADVRAAVLKLVPLGTPLDSAQQLLKKHGLTCIKVERLPGTPWDIACTAPVQNRFRPRREMVVRFVSRDTFWLGRESAHSVIRADSLILVNQRDSR